MASIKCGHCTKTHTSVEMVRNCAFSAQADTKIPAFINMKNKGVNTTQVMAAFGHEVGAHTFVATPAPAPVTEAGMYQKPNGTVYRVKLSKKNGFPYAEKMVPGKYGKVTFQYVAYEIKTLTADMRMTLEDAAKAGAQYGACCVCGRTLTNKDSIEAGIGPICSGKI